MGILQEKLLDALDKKKAPVEQKEDVEPKVEQKEEVVETTEENKEEVLSNTENKEEETVEEKVEETKTEETVSEAKTIDWEFLSETLGRKVSSVEDLVIEKEVEKTIEKEKEYLSEFSKGYDQFYKDTGRSVDDYLLATRDVEKLTKDDVVRENLRAENPSLDKSKLDFLYKSLYGVDEDTMSEDEITMKQIKFEQDYNKGVNSLKQIKEKYVTPLDNSIASNEARAKEQQLAAEQQSKMWAEAIEKTNSELKTIDISFEDGFKYNHVIDEGVKKQAKEIASDLTMSKWAQRYQGKDGSVDHKKIQEDIYIRDNFKTLLSEAYKQGQANKLEEEIKKDKHIDFKKTEKPSTGSKLSKQAQAELDLLRKRFPKAFKK